MFLWLIQISDGGNPERTVDVVSVITIQDINDTPPKFDPSYYNVTVSESFNTRNPIITVSATDPDENSVLTFMIVDGNADDSFLINCEYQENKWNLLPVIWVWLVLSYVLKLCVIHIIISG